jgi:hypothetical protein
MMWTALALWPNLALAEGWQDLTGTQITEALAARVVEYDDGGTQNFFADGRTLFEVDAGESWGKWRVEGDLYCSVWPPNELWECYSVSRETAGLGLRFTAKDGEVSAGHYIDLQ